MEPNGEIIGEPNYQKVVVYPEITETPSEFLRAAQETEMISYRELKDYVNKLKANGIELDQEEVTLQSKLSFPWQALLVMFLSVPLLTKTATRRMIAPRVLACLLIVFLFHISGALLLALGMAGKIMPIMSAWTHNFVFGVGTFFFLDRANF